MTNKVLKRYPSCMATEASIIRPIVPRDNDGLIDWRLECPEKGFFRSH